VSAGRGAARPDDGSELRLDDAFVRRLARMRLPLRRVGHGVGARPGARRVPAADFIDHRPYAPGDDVRHIDWANLARHDAVTIRLGPATHAADVRLVLDASRSMAASPDAWRLARELAAALGWLALSAGDRLELVTLPSGRAWGPRSGAALGGAWLAHVASIEPEDGASRLGPALRRAVRAAPWGGTLYILSDLWLGDDLDEALVLAPAPRWEAHVAHVLGREQLEPSLDGALALTDRESGDVLELVVDAEVRAAYRTALDGWLERVQAACAARGATWRLVPGDLALEEALGALLAPAPAR